ncbi:hypothetical protein [Paraburkholderia phenazinium]|uniref:Uncharacterized protein n=1 Tax=Paraburkholderia phenazinium TaxID=60549 RepID=A0A1N6KYI0_9BURK|nr:hypothetical protein [Paraburkholderia phenazinium]SIO61555.1 hypothetical protein SAMN05444165_5268 [Paraburkholderia phenazinium]
MAGSNFIPVAQQIIQWYQTVKFEGREPIRLPFKSQLGHRDQREMQLWDAVRALRGAISAMEQAVGTDDGLSAGLQTLDAHVGRYVTAAHAAHAWIAKIMVDSRRMAQDQSGDSLRGTPDSCA